MSMLEASIEADIQESFKSKNDIGAWMASWAGAYKRARLAEHELKALREKETLWDRYAQAALSGLLVNGTEKAIVKQAAIFADAMMNERQKRFEK